MKIKFEVPNNTGQAYGNLLRTMLIENGESIKPIGIRFSDDSNTFIPNSNVVEVLKFCQSLSDLTYIASENVSFPIQQNYTCQGSLKSDDLNKADIKVKESGIVLLNTINKDKPFNFSLIFDKGCGKKDTEYNKQVLESASGSEGSFVALSSRYSDSKVSFTVKDNLGTEVVDLTVECKSGKEEERVRNCVDTIINCLQKID